MFRLRCVVLPLVFSKDIDVQGPSQSELILLPLMRQNGGTDALITKSLVYQYQCSNGEKILGHLS